MHAYVLIQTEIARELDVATALAAVPGVVSVETITGPYDIIVRVEADSLDAVGRIVVNSFQNVDGIDRTLTCPVLGP
ncbi:MAG: Lrp/AsnC family transcriptional regulator [Acidimicrobiia bacterium]